MPADHAPAKARARRAMSPAAAAQALRRNGYGVLDVATTDTLYRALRAALSDHRQIPADFDAVRAALQQQVEAETVDPADPRHLDAVRAETVHAARQMGGRGHEAAE